jgi:hypothetical protein
MPTVMQQLQNAVELNAVASRVSCLNSVFIVLLQTEPTSRETEMRIPPLLTYNNMSCCTPLDEFGLVQL